MRFSVPTGWNTPKMNLVKRAWVSEAYGDVFPTSERSEVISASD